MIEQGRPLENWRVNDSDIEQGVEIGRGRSGTVYRVRYQGVSMACKRLSVGANQQRAQVERFLLKEAKALSRLRHPNIIRLFHVCISASSLCLLMEYADKGTLRDELDRAIQESFGLQKMLRAVQPARVTDDEQQVVVGELPAWRKFQVLHQLVLALRAVHQLGALHQDIKPSNCLIMQVHFVCQVVR
jgi:serine/threonine protein kinase